MSASLGKFEAQVLSDTEVAIQRIFAVPRELMYRAFVEAELIPQWWGLHTTSATVDLFDVRPGGMWRIVQREQDGTEYAFRGVFLELEPPVRIVQTVEFEPIPGQPVVDTMTLNVIPEGTLMRIVSAFDSKEQRDGLLREGMEAAANETYDRLEKLVATLA